jgi:CRP-like cAMP-binding protein/anti-anti-sigma regulatory factor
LLFAVTLGTLVGKLPIVVFSAIAVITGIHILDKWVLRLSRRLARLLWDHGPSALRQEKEAVIDFMTAAVVTGITMREELVLAIGFGVAIASALFIIRFRKSIIRRKYYGDKFHSRRLRPPEDIAILEREGRQVAVFELQGSLFFGSAEELAREIEIALLEANYCILDMERLIEIDATGANIIFQIYRRIAAREQHLLISHLGKTPALDKFLSVMDVSRPGPNLLFFPDTDSALDWAEESLLTTLSPFSKGCRQISLYEADIAEGLSISELFHLSNRLIHETYTKEEQIIEKGDESRNLYILTRGSVSLKMPQPERSRDVRLFTYCPGVALGAIGVLEGKPLPASAIADEECELYRLPYQKFLELRKEEPELAIKLLTNIGKNISQDLRLSVSAWMAETLVRN